MSKEVQELLNNLERVREKERPKVYPTFSINWCSLLGDVINTIYRLIDKVSELEQSKKVLNAIELAIESEEVELFKFEDVWMVRYLKFDESDHLDYWYESEVKNA